MMRDDSGGTDGISGGRSTTATTSNQGGASNLPPWPRPLRLFRRFRRGGGGGAHMMPTTGGLEGTDDTNTGGGVGTGTTGDNRSHCSSFGTTPSINRWGSGGPRSVSINSYNNNNNNANKRSSSAMTTSFSRSSRRIHRAVCIGRTSFVLFLLGVAACACILLYTYLHQAERNLAMEQFQQMANRATNAIVDVVSMKRHSMVTMSVMMSEQLRHKSDWPFQLVHGYDRIVRQLAATGKFVNMGFAPIIPAQLQSQWEDYAYKYYASLPHYPNTSGINSFGKGIWKPLPNKTRVHDVALANNESFLIPNFQCCVDNPGDPGLLFNQYSGKQRRETIDTIMNCTNTLAAASYNHNITTTSTNSTTVSSSTSYLQSSSSQQYHQQFPDHSCGSITEFVTIHRFKHRGPASLMIQPIWPSDSPWQITGLVVSPMIWDEIFDNVFSSKINGIHCVLESETQIHTYTISNGLVETFASGDLHQTKYDDLGRTVNLTWFDLHEMGAPMYKLSMYPTDQYLQSSYTSNPTTAAIAALGVILVTSLLFLLYDYFVQREFHQNKSLLEAKRKFMRYVSHEVRTPLNAVVMGLNVVHAELQQQQEQKHKQHEDSAVNAAGADTDDHHHTLLLKLEEGQREVEDEEEGRDGSGSDSDGHRCGCDCHHNDNNNSTNESLLELLQEIQTSAESAVDVLNDVLNYDKIERSALKLELSMVPILQLVERTLLEFKLPAAKKQVTLEIVYKDNSSSAGPSSSSNFLTAKSDSASSTNDALGALSPQQVVALGDNSPHHQLSMQDLRVKGDNSRIAQILRNLLSNALKFTPSRGRILVQICHNNNVPTKTARGEKTATTAVTIPLHDGSAVSAIPQGSIQLSVQDSGVGMSKSQLDHLFGEGVQFNVNKLQAGQGSGLGLFITKGLVKQHKGTLDVSSDGLGQGSTFTLELPVFRVPQEHQHQPSSIAGSLSLFPPSMNSSLPSPSPSSAALSTTVPPPPPNNDSSNNSNETDRLRLLIVDDVLSNRKFLCRLLERKGHICDMAENGQEAVDKIQSKMRSGDDGYDSVLMDYEMPIMNGPEAAFQIRNAGCDVFIVGITGNMLGEDVDYFKSQGANAVLPKPLQLHALEEVWMEYDIAGGPSQLPTLPDQVERTVSFAGISPQAA